MLSNILFRFSTDGNRGAAFSAEVLRKGIADRSNCHNDAVRSSRRRRTDDDKTLHNDLLRTTSPNLNDLMFMTSLEP